jgi:hypothetical protein
MPCEERARLEREYQVASGTFDRARRDLQTKIGTLPKRDYKVLSRAAEQAWESLQKVHAALDKHLREHSCLA